MAENDETTQRQKVRRQEGDLSRRQVLGWTLGTVAVVGAVGAGAMVSGEASNEATVAAPAKAEAGQQLDGTWYVNFNIVPPTPTPLLIHINFTPNGGVIAANTPGAILPGMRSALQQVGLGEWVRTGDREFTFRYNFHVFELRTDGTPLSRAELVSVWVSVELNETLDRWTGTWKRRNVDSQGAFIRGAEGVTEAERIKIFPIE